MVSYKGVAAAFVVLTIILAGATGYLLAYPAKATETSTTTQSFTAPPVTNTSSFTATSTITSTQTVNTTVSGGLSPAFSVNIAYKAGIGFYLTNGTGFTLYFRSTDKPYNGTTTCKTTTCEANWPAFYTSSLSLAPGINASAFSTITPYNNTKILTYDGYPLFYWIHDTQPGDTTGQGTGGFYVATVPTPTVPPVTSTTSTISTTTATSSSMTTTGSGSAQIIIPAGIAANLTANFEPSTISVAPGTTIVFVNKDTTNIHNVHFMTMPSGATFATNPSPNTNLWTNNMFSVTLTVAGTYTYVCDYHSWMTGTITVT